MKKITLDTLANMRERGEKITCLTAYDASFSSLLNKAGVDVILIGDTLGMVYQGHRSTVPVTIEEMVYHTQCVSRANSQALLIGDMPFMSYATKEQALLNARQLMQAGAHMVKLEGGEWLYETIQCLTERGIPVCSHLGLQPQSVHQLSGFKIQGRDSLAAEKIIQDATLLEQAGTRLLFLECIPIPLAKNITEKIGIPTIGIGAGPHCSGQVLVLYDILGISENHHKYRFSKNFLDDATSVLGALTAYVQAVKQGNFPTIEQGYE